MTINELIEELKKINVILKENQVELLKKYSNYLMEYNEHTNLTAIKTSAEIYLKHFYDSLTVTKAVDFSKEISIIDIGSGAGFPGIVLKIVFPNIKLTVLDSNHKKTDFISSLVKELNISGVEIVNDRAEEYAKTHKNIFDLCVSRAVAFLDIITELSTPLIKQTGKIILMKGNLNKEIDILNKHKQELNIKDYQIINFKLPISNDERNLVVIDKNLETKEIKDYNHIIKQNKKWSE